MNTKNARHGLRLAVFCVLFAIPAMANEEALIAYYSFDEECGTTAKDLGANQNDGIFAGHPRRVAGRFGAALEFDGANDFVQCQIASNLNIDAAITIEMWVQRTDNRIAYLLFGEGDNFGIEIRDGCIGLLSNWPGRWTCIIKAQEPLTPNRWTHVVITWDMRTGDAFVYYNGIRVGAGAGMRGAMKQPPQYLQIGALAPKTGKGMFFHGAIDEVKIYNRVLSPDEARERAGGTIY